MKYRNYFIAIKRKTNTLQNIQARNQTRIIGITSQCSTIRAGVNSLLKVNSEIN